MAWTLPRTWSPGETVTAALMNQHLRDNLNILKTSIDDDGGIPLGFVASSDTPVSNSGTNPTDLHTHDLAANILAVGEFLRLTAWGSGATANNKTYSVSIGSVTLTFAASTVVGRWRVEVTIARSATGTARIEGIKKYDAGTVQIPTPATGAADFTGVLTVKTAVTASGTWTEDGWEVQKVVG